MTTTLRIDDRLKKECEAIFSDIGLNMSTAINLFLRQVAKQRCIPFALTCERVDFREIPDFAPPQTTSGETAKRLFAEMRANAVREMSLDEINAEISAARAERRALKASFR